MFHCNIYDAWERNDELHAIILVDGSAVNLLVKSRSCTTCGARMRTFEVTQLQGKVVVFLHLETSSSGTDCRASFSTTTKWIIETIYSTMGKKHTMIHYNKYYGQRTR